MLVDSGRLIEREQTPLRILVLCVGNSCRSQMAEAWFNSLNVVQMEVRSAGTEPAGFVHPMAEQVMLESGVSFGEQFSKSVDRFINQQFDYVITVCAEAEDACPDFPGTAKKVHWYFDDPAITQGSETAMLDKFRQVRDEIQGKIAEFLHQFYAGSNPDQ